MKRKLIALICALILLLAVCAILYAGADDQTEVITSQIDTRDNSDYPVWEIIVTASYDADDTGVSTQAVHINGILQKVIMELPDTATDNTTTQLLINDNGDHTIFDSGEKTEGEGVTYVFNLYEPVAGTIDVVLEPSAAYGSTEILVVTLRGI